MIVLRSFFKLLTVFAVGGLAYGLLEVLVRSYTFISMGIIGGICMVIIHLLNDERRNRSPKYMMLKLAKDITGYIV